MIKSNFYRRGELRSPEIHEFARILAGEHSSPLQTVINQRFSGGAYIPAIISYNVNKIITKHIYGENKCFTQRNKQQK